jgi:DDE superfamily endonuclease
MDERDILFLQHQDSSDSSSDGSNYERSLGSSSSSSSSSSSEFSMMDIDDSIDEAMQMAVSILWDLEGGLEDSTIRWRDRHEGLLICEISDDDAIAHFRFRKTHLQELSDMLWPRLHQFLPGATSPSLVVFEKGNYSAPYETMLLMVLFRFSRPRRIHKDMEAYFGYRRSKISASIKAMVHALHALSLQYLDDPSIFQHRMAYYAERIFAKCGVVRCVWGFIDGTLRKTCRPSFFQKLLYSGHKRAHGIKFQSVVAPDGLFTCMFGPITGNRHDSYMLAKSRLIPKLREVMPPLPAPAIDGNQYENLQNHGIFSLYGDPAYPQSLLLFGGYRNPRPGSREARWNTEMSKVREVVEWAFANLIKNWAFLDFRASMMVFKSPVAKYYMIAAFLMNCRSCFYGNQTMQYFDCEPLTLQQYLSLVPEPPQ